MILVWDNRFQLCGSSWIVVRCNIAVSDFKLVMLLHLLTCIKMKIDMPLYIKKKKKKNFPPRVKYE